MLSMTNIIRNINKIKINKFTLKNNDTFILKPTFSFNIIFIVKKRVHDYEYDF